MTQLRPISPAARQVPYSADSERDVLGSLFLNPAAFDDIVELLEVSDFYRADHQILFQELQAMYQARAPIDLSTVVDRLRRSEKLEEVGGFAYVASLANDTPSASNVLVYARQVREYSTLRKLICVGGDMAEMGYRPDGRSVPELVDAAQQAVTAIGEREQTAVAEDIGSLAAAFEETVDRRRISLSTGAATGLVTLDNKLGGMQPGDLIVLAGRPSMGKTALAMNIADHVSATDPVAVFSMEMSREQVTARQASLHSGVPLHLFLNPREMSKAQQDAFTEAVKVLRTRRMVVDDRGALSVLQVRAKARKLARRQRLGLIVVDYIQLMAGTGGNRNEEVNDVTRGLKALGKELNCPVIALSQLNRGCESRDNKRPRLSDLRESGGIEQDADIVIGLYRHEYYHPNETVHAGIAEAVVLKHRNGPTGSLELRWNGEVCQFSDYVGPNFDARQPRAEDRGARGFSRPKPALVRSLNGEAH